MPNERRSFLEVRHHRFSRPLALAATVVLGLNLLHASAWASGVLTTVTGGGSAGAPGFAGDGGHATAAQLNGPAGVAVDVAGNVVIADTANQRIRRIDAATGIITTIAGGGAGSAPGFGGDGGPAISAQLDRPAGVAVDAAGNVVIADTANQRVRRVDAATGIITTIAGGGTPGFSGDGGRATSARLANPSGVAVDAAGNVVIADTANQRIRRIDAATGIITTLAGGGTEAGPGSVGDGGPATTARLASPSGVAVDGAANVVIADTANQRIRRVDAATGIITTLAGGAAEATSGFGGDGGPAQAAQLSEPAAVAVDGAANVVIADTANQRIRRVDAATGIITTLAGGVEAVVVAGSGGAQATPLGVRPPAAGPEPAPGPRGVAIDRSGAVFIANSPRNRIDKAEPATSGATPPNSPLPPDAGSLCTLVNGAATGPISASPSWTARTVSLSTTTAAPGQRLEVEGNGFSSGQQLTVTLCSAPTILGTVTADSLGSYRADVKLPGDIAPGAHHLVLSDASGNAAVALRVIRARAGAGAGAGAEGAGSADPTMGADGTAPTDGSDSAGRNSAGSNSAGSDSADGGLTDHSIGDPLDPGLDTSAADVGGPATDSNGMPTTGGEFITLMFLAGGLMKVGGALVLAGRRKSAAS